LTKNKNYGHDNDHRQRIANRVRTVTFPNLD